MTYPTIRLKPKANAQRLRHGFPWVYDNELVLDRRSRKIPAGSLAVLEDHDRRPLALVGVNTGSKITARVLDQNPEAVIDGAWFHARIARAFSLRDRLYPTPHYRLIHAEGDGLPGVIVDRFDDLLVVQPNAAWADLRIDDLAAALQDVTGANHVILNATSRARAQEGLPQDRRAVIGAMPDAPIPVPMNGAVYMADIAGGQKTGLFYDQRPNHAFAAQFARDARVLDVFSHVGGFGLAALAGGAAHVTCVDGSFDALALATQGAAIMQAEARFDTLKSDAFDALEGFEAQSYDMVICDPPAFAPSKNALQAGLRAYERVAKLAAPLVKTGGILGLCSCSHAASVELFRAASIRGIGRGIGQAGRQAQLIHTGHAGPDHPQHVMLAENAYLKSLFFRITA